MRRHALLAIVLAACTVPASASAQSLWREGAAAANLYADHRARMVNDIVTIVIVESSSSSRSASTTTSKDTSRSFGVNKFPTLFDEATRRTVKPVLKELTGASVPSEIAEQQLGFDFAGKANHEGKGAIERSDKVTGQIAARVVKVLDNGNLMIEGRRAVLVNNETQIITISGIVRGDDVSPSNTVLSSQIADAEIQMVGKGLLADAQRPSLLYRLFDWLRLF
jgi:flagellar L-ring protein FlgH